MASSKPVIVYGVLKGTPYIDGNMLRATITTDQVVLMKTQAGRDLSHYKKGQEVAIELSPDADPRAPVLQAVSISPSARLNFAQE